MMKTLSALPILALVAFSGPVQAIAQTQQPNTPPPDYYWPGPGHMMWGYWGGGWPFWGMFPMMFLFMILLCVVVFYFGRGAIGGGRHHWGPSSHDWPDPSYSALQILNERFARGEVQKQEYEEKKGAILSGARGRV
jgi:putative membrane protein